MTSLLVLAAGVWLCWLGSAAQDQAAMRGDDGWGDWTARLAAAALLACGQWWMQWQGQLSWLADESWFRAALAWCLQAGGLLMLTLALIRRPQSRVRLLLAALICWLLLTLAAAGNVPLLQWHPWLADWRTAPTTALFGPPAMAAVQTVALLWALSVHMQHGHRLAPIFRIVALTLTCAAAWAGRLSSGPAAALSAAANPAGPELFWLGLVLLSTLGAWMGRGPSRAPAPRRVPTAAPAAQPSEILIDALTGLPSRIGIERELQALVVRSDHQKSRLAVLMCNLDGFSSVNSSFGHDFGDQMLRETAQRLRAALRDGESVGRIGADDFLCLIPDAGNDAQIAERARALQARLSLPLKAGTQELSLSCSVGITLYPDHGGSARLLSYADAAKVAAKRMGGACFSMYEPSMKSDGRGELDLLNDLRKALQRAEMELYFQPKIDATSGQITAAEALLRWHHPTRGMVMPAVFIPIAERFGLMRELGNWVIEAACTQAQLWREHGLRMRVAVNLSPQQMYQADIVERIADSLHQHHIHPSLLTCEITESLAMENTEVTQQTFQRMGQMGVHLSIDDFGTGYSSLSYLRQLPAGEVKIDRSFVTDVDSSRDARAVVDAIVRLAHALGLRVVAEGVETQGQYAALLQLGCDELQGYLFAKPMSAESLLVWAKEDQQRDKAAFKPSLFGDTDLDVLS